MPAICSYSLAFLALVIEWKCGDPNKGSNVVQCYMGAILGMRDVAGKKKLGYEGRVFCFTSWIDQLN